MFGDQIRAINWDPTIYFTITQCNTIFETKIDKFKII